MLSHTLEGGVGAIVLDHPKVNAYDIELMTQLRELADMFDRDRSTRVVILRSALPQVFSVGADIKTWAANDAAANQRLVDTARQVTAAIGASDKIYVAAINGHALGGGLELAMACDLRFAAAGEYQLGLPEVKLGLMPGNGGTQRLARLVGTSRALELAVTGRSIDPAMALSIGLVDRVVGGEELLDTAVAFSRSLAAGPRQAIAAIKRSIRDGADRDLGAALELEWRLSDGLYGTPDAAEGFRAYVERRAPSFGDTTLTT